MNQYEFRIYVLLSGDMEYLLCTVYTPEAAAAVVGALCGAAKPAYTRVSIQIAPVTPG
jgi:hypothetical protein